MIQFSITNRRRLAYGAHLRIRAGWCRSRAQPQSELPDPRTQISIGSTAATHTPLPERVDSARSGRSMTSPVCPQLQTNWCAAANVEEGQNLP